MGESARFLGGTGGKVELNGSSKKLLQLVPDTLGKLTLHLFNQIRPPPLLQNTKKIKNCIF